MTKLPSSQPDEEALARLKILYWFFDRPTTPISLSDLAQEVEVAKSSASKVVERLVADGFLEKEVLGRTWRLICKEPVNAGKIPYHLDRIYGIWPELSEAIRKIAPNPRAIILFGSYRKGDDIETSDLDLAVEVLDDEEVEVINLGTIPEFGYRRNVNVNLTVFSRNRVDLNLFANIVNGIVLEGFLEARP